MLLIGRPLYFAEKGQERAAGYEPLNYTMEEIYDLRRDCEGQPAGRAARTATPSQSSSVAGQTHLLLADAAQGRVGSWYEVGGQTVRVVQGAGEGISTVRGRYKEPPSSRPADIVICAGAVDQGVPARVVSDGRGDSVVRPAGGAASRWLLLDAARAELNF